jgi:hypothetical protein
MQKFLDDYLKREIDNVIITISGVINQTSINNLPINVQSQKIVNEVYNKALSFINYYNGLNLPINQNTINLPNFFSEFRNKYGLRFDHGYTQFLQNNSNNIYNLFQANNLFKIYEYYFENAPITKNGIQTTQKQKVPFSKLLHLLEPSKYAPVDNDILKYFGFGKTHFHTSYFILNEAYKDWISQNKQALLYIRRDLNIHDLSFAGTIKVNNLSDIRILDLVIFHIAHGLI